MKKALYTTGIVLLLMGGIVAGAGADEVFPSDSPIQSTDDVISIITNIAELAFQIFFIVAVLFILFAAYTYLTAGDDASKVDKAKTSLKNAVIAIVIALISTGVATIIDQFLRDNS